MPANVVTWGPLIQVLASIFEIQPSMVIVGLSKALEYSDHAIFAASGGIVSGHTLKHLAAAAACYALLRYIAQRRPLAVPANDPRTAPDTA